MECDYYWDSKHFLFYKISFLPASMRCFSRIFTFITTTTTTTTNRVFTSRCLSYDKLSHLDQKGGVKMVDVGNKSATKRFARAVARITFKDTIFRNLMNNSNFSKKGNILEVAKLGGIMAAKRTHEIIPLCHLVPLNHVSVEVSPDGSSLKVSCEVRCESRTGCEMEALVGVSVACLTIYDMCKSVSHDICIENIQLEEKSGGQSGHFVNTSIHT